MTNSALFMAVFLACAVEAVEALTIVLAAGTARDWRSAITGLLAGMVTLAAVVALLGPALSAIPLDGLRLFVGGLLLVFGLQWLRKAILRASGHKALHDEAMVFESTLAAARRAGVQRRGPVLDWYAFTLSYKGVLLEGLEVAFIALTFGANQHNIPLAAARRGRRRTGGGRCRHRGAGAAVSGAREQHEVRRRRHADRVRDVLGCRGSRCALAAR